MHVMFVSMCEKRAISKTSTVLDAYANRHGDRTWITPITSEGLETVRQQLRSVATRQTAVSCYVNDGIRGMRLVWTVGSNKAFGPNGSVAVATRGARRLDARVELSPALRSAALLARCAGYGHDFGKFGKMFADKLRRSIHGEGPMADTVRHEWLSLHALLRASLEDPSDPIGVVESQWKTLWDVQGSRKISVADDLFGHGKQMHKGIVDPFSALLFLVFTHHRLPQWQGAGESGSSYRLSEGTYIRYKPDSSSRLDESERAMVEPVGAPSAQTFAMMKHAWGRIQKTSSGLPPDPILWRAVSTVARMALILADHSVSSEVKHGDPLHDPSIPGIVFANTTFDASGKRVFNQELNWHLTNVGDRAADYLSRMLSFKPEGLSEDVLNVLRQPAPGRFAWQSQASDALRLAQHERRMPTLVINVAGTGSGKTRGNVAIAAALRDSTGSSDHPEPVRIATALNLRTLTLQTRDAYADEIRMSKSELACVIGCKTSMLLHDARSKGVNKSSASAAEQELSSWGVDEDGNPLEDVFDAEGDSELPPEWLDNFLSRKPKMKSVVMAPALVCTIDHLIHAGDPTQQGNHALTNLRLMTSDLILDEIDSYDSSALLSVLQVVAMAGLWGRHVIASSATTSLPVAEALWTAYSLGIRMRSRLFGTSKGAAGKPGKDVWDCEFRVALVDDRNPTRLLVSQPENEIHSRGEFVAWFQQGLFAMLESMGWTRKRPGELIRVKLKDLEKTGDVELANERIMRAISRSSRIMHDRHAWDIEVDGSMHRISIGLVRIANIRNAVKTAVHLLESHEARITKESTGDNNGDASDHDVDLRVACYHSQLPRIQRYLLECELDTILTRKGKAGTGPEASRKLIEAVRLSRSKGFSQTRFIVVATPVEEVGRDHDFDWAIIEPSSTHSIVQTGGRVNRHRLLDFDVPNIGVLQYNFRYAKNVSSDRDMPVFSMPGNETRKIRYREYNLSKLIDWEELNRCGQIDARLRFSSEKHGFASHDDNAIRMAIASTMRQFVQCDHFGWMGAGTYTDTPLREPVSKIPCSMNESQDDKVRYLYKKNGKLVHEWMTIRLNKEIEPEGAWLTWSFDEALDRAKELGLDSLDAFHVELPIYRNSEDSNVSNEEIIERKYVRLGGFGYFQE